MSIRLAPEHSTTMDVGYRASAVAVGAATFNARVAAAAHGLIGKVDFQPGDEASPLRAIVHLSSGDDPELSPLYEAMLPERRTGGAVIEYRSPFGPSRCSTRPPEARAPGSRSSASLLTLTGPQPSWPRPIASDT